MPNPRAVVFENPVAPNGDPQRLRAALDEHFGAGAYRIVTTPADAECSHDIDREVLDAARDGCDLAIAVGGDGTVALVARSLHRLGDRAGAMVLGMVPCGTANILSRELDIPSKIDEAVAIAATRPRVVPLDAIGFEDRLFLTQVGIGLDATMIHDTTREAQRRFKRWSYVATLARRALGHRSQRFRLRVDGRVIRVTAFQVLIANASTLGAKPFVWGPDIDPTDGVLDLCIFQVQRLRDIVALAWMMLTGQHEASSHARFIHARKEVHVESGRPLRVQGDGESLGHTPIHLTVISGAVRVAAPLEPASAAEDAPTAAADSGGARPPPARKPFLREAWARGRRVIGAADTLGYLAVNRLEGGLFVDRGLWWCSRLLDRGEAWALAALIAAWADGRHLRDVPLLVLPPLWLAMLTVNFPLKSLFRRRRPFLAHDRAKLRGRKPKDTSFPSGHTAAAFAGAALLSTHLPGFAPLFYAYALLVSFSRIYLGMHFPADVVAGGIVGTGLGALYGWLWSAALGALRALHPGI